MSEWVSARGPGRWRHFLTEVEREVVRAAEFDSREAKAKLANATERMRLIRMRGAQRALAADRRKVKPKSRNRAKG
jgi:hypothetical protein